MARVDKNEQFTIREYAITPGYFLWQEPMSTLDETVTCIMGSDGFTDEWGRYRQVTFTAMEFDCRYDIVQLSVDIDGVVDDSVTNSF